MRRLSHPDAGGFSIRILTLIVLAALLAPSVAAAVTVSPRPACGAPLPRCAVWSTLEGLEVSTTVTSADGEVVYEVANGLFASVRAARASDGVLLWSYEGLQRITNAMSTVGPDGDLYIAWPGDIMRFDKDTGQWLWQHPFYMGRPIFFEFRPTGLFFVGHGGTSARIDPATGDFLWMDTLGVATDAAIDASGTRMVVSTPGGSLFRYHALTGGLVWAIYDHRLTGSQVEMMPGGTTFAHAYAAANGEITVDEREWNARIAKHTTFPGPGAPLDLDVSADGDFVYVVADGAPNGDRTIRGLFRFTASWQTMPDRDTRLRISEDGSTLWTYREEEYVPEFRMTARDPLTGLTLRSISHSEEGRPLALKDIAFHGERIYLATTINDYRGSLVALDAGSIALPETPTI